MNSKLHIITVATEIKLCMKYLIESIKKNNAELIILGYGLKWEGFNWRNKLVLDYISNLNDDDIICFVDGYDVLCIRDLNELVDEFYKIKTRENCKMIVGFENQLNFYNYLMSQIIFGNCNGLSVNAGTYISTVKDLREIINGILEKNILNNSDDQVLLTNYCNNKPNDIYIDKKTELFLTLTNSTQQLDLDKYYITNGDKIEIIYNSNKPFFLHAAGNTCIDNVLLKLGYESDNILCNSIIESSNKKVDYYFNIMFENTFKYIIIIVILIIIVLINFFYLKK
jgi:hypothetical protein